LLPTHLSVRSTLLSRLTELFRCVQIKFLEFIYQWMSWHCIYILQVEASVIKWTVLCKCEGNIMRWNVIVQHDYRLLWFLIVSCCDVGSRTSCISERVHEGSHVLAIQCPDSWFADIMLMFHGNAILFILSH
jgi:hypothetical protein